MTRAKEQFEPADPPRVTMYVCGPTVYSYPHIGNARPAVVFDVLARLLRRTYQVTYARNITDVEDKINAAAKEEGVDISVITERFTNVYHEDMEALDVLAPDIEPKVTDHLNQIVDMIGSLIEAGFAYHEQGHVLFDVTSYPDYGALSRRDHGEMLAGARVEVAPYKRDPADFVLWKPSDEDTVGWPSPWGRGRPGWHIECSVMAATKLGKTIDIHGGGQDLIFPHHENEIAQSTCANQQLYARFWMHNGFVNVDAEKMSKSLGNVLLVRDLLNEASGEAIRLGLLTAHYRQPLDWSDTLLNEAKTRLNRLYTALSKVPFSPQGPDPEDASQKVLDALEDDMNTPRAIAELFSIANQLNKANEPERPQLARQLRASGWLLGLLQQDPRQWLGSEAGGEDSELIQRLIGEREALRAARDYQAADGIRDRLLDMGIAIEDGPEGTTWRRIRN